MISTVASQSHTTGDSPDAIHLADPLRTTEDVWTYTHTDTHEAAEVGHGAEAVLACVWVHA